ncbi:MAG: hypothetical protein NWS83_09970, partial [Burkholderiaceae bacterium]|nr:hypothetical protein [Burkholderiaceae bacterium]
MAADVALGKARGAAALLGSAEGACLGLMVVVVPALNEAANQDLPVPDAGLLAMGAKGGLLNVRCVLWALGFGLWFLALSSLLLCVVY